MRQGIVAVAIAMAGCAGNAVAAEGMWVPQQLSEIAGPLKKAGLKLDVDRLADLTGDPMGAVVSINGCTASFVSPRGLVVTNHHCAYGAIQLNSTPERNLLETGFNAAAAGDEVSAGPNARIHALDSIRDVTTQVRSAIDAAPDALGRSHALETVEKQLVAQCEAEAGFRCRLYSFAGGNTYRLFRNIEIRDVRLVYAPPSSIGNYGGEIDNWMWPRHTGDFSFYRAYVGKDGKPAAFAADNVPYRPARHLKLADQPLETGDFVMVAGYPGSTSRYALAADFDATATWGYPVVGGHYKNLVALIEAASRKDSDIAVKYANTVRFWQNGVKNYDGQLEGFERIGAAQTKHAEEAAVLAWLRSTGPEGDAALAAHARLVQLGDEERTTRDRDLVFEELRSFGAIGAAARLYRFAIERTKPDIEREPGFQERDVPSLQGSLKQMERRYDPRMDRQLQAYWLSQYVKLPASQRIAAVDQWLGGSDEQAVERALDKLATTGMRDSVTRLAMLDDERAAFEASEDPAVQFAVATMPTVLQLEEAEKRRAGDLLRARPVYLQAVADYRRSRGESVYPDANSSLRITFGNVTGYTGKDGTRHQPFTRLEEVAAKATGQDPFAAPQALLDAVSARKYAGLSSKQLGTVPVNFLSDLDITGGNSGSPVLDAHGRLVGLAFDGNWESVSSNWVFDPTMNRMISVDLRYMRWIMQAVYPAPQLLQELDVPAQG